MTVGGSTLKRLLKASVAETKERKGKRSSKKNKLREEGEEKSPEKKCSHRRTLGGKSKTPGSKATMKITEKNRTPNLSEKGYERD